MIMQSANKYCPWHIIEKNWKPASSRFSESIFSLANEFVGIRGNFEEGISCDSLQGSYFNGIYEQIDNNYIWPRVGFAKHYCFIANNIQWIGLYPEIDGEKLDMINCDISDYTRQIDMHNALLSRSFVWKTRSGQKLQMLFERFISMDDHSIAAIRLTINSVDFNGDLKISACLDGSALHEQFGNCPRIDVIKTQIDENHSQASMLAKTKTTNLHSAVAMKLCSSRHIRWSNDQSCKDKANLCGTVSICPGQNIVITKYIGFASQVTTTPQSCCDDAVKSARRASEEGWDTIFEANHKHWSKFWQDSDIQIEGDLQSQQAIRFVLFQLHMTYNGFNSRFNVAPKGLTGENYGGATFWDTETYAIPFYAFTNPQAARNLLEYRCRQLPQYRLRAKEMRSAGAILPMITINGEENCPIWDLGNHEVHINGAFAFTMWLLEKTGQDIGFAVEALCEFARYWTSRCSYSHHKNCYVINTVVGPDEWRPMSDNNAYTNAIAAFTLRYAAQKSSDLAKDHANAIGLKSSEPASWRDIADSLFMQAADAKLGIIPQDDTYLNAQTLMRYQIDDNDRPLHSKWPYDLILRSGMLKQPDVIFAYYVLGEKFCDLNMLRRCMRFYEPRTMHDSSLSQCVHGIIASRLNMAKHTYSYIRQSLRLDLKDLNHNTCQGLHITAMCGAWSSVVLGLGGLSWHTGEVELWPTIPEEWTSYSFKFTHKGSILKVSISKEKCKIEVSAGKSDIPITLFGSPLTLKPGSEITQSLKPMETKFVNGALFDLDGVLVSTDKFHYQAWKRIADEEGIYFDEKINHCLRGVSRMESFEILLKNAKREYPESEKACLADRKNKYFQQLIEQLTPSDLLDGAQNIIAILKSKGWKIALCSSSKNARYICEKLDILNVFDAIIDGNEISNTKPHPEIFIKAAHSLGLYPGDCVVFEDAQSGIDAAKAAGAATVGIVSDDNQLKGADISVANLSQIDSAQLQHI